MIWLQLLVSTVKELIWQCTCTAQANLHTHLSPPHTHTSVHTTSAHHHLHIPTSTYHLTSTHPHLHIPTPPHTPLVCTHQHPSHHTAHSTSTHSCGTGEEWINSALHLEQDAYHTEASHLLQDQWVNWKLPGHCGCLRCGFLSRGQPKWVVVGTI